MPTEASTLTADMERVDMDSGGDGDLPSYAELQQQAPPNSRFGRWREWVDKRAAERFADQTEQDREERHNRLGWGESLVDMLDDSDQVPEPRPESRASTVRQQSRDSYSDLPSDPPATAPSNASLRSTISAQSKASSKALPNPPSYYPKPSRIGEPLPPTRAALYSFGSRFLSHSSEPIQCLLPILRDRFLLMGTVEGLSVLDVLPRLHGEEPLSRDNGLEDARQREVWTGVGLIQCELLEDGAKNAGPEQGIVLALVAAHHVAEGAAGKSEPSRLLRMYNLSSLISLVKWTVTQKDSQPVQLNASQSWSVHKSPSAKQKHRSSMLLGKGLKALLIDDTPSDSPAPTDQRQSLQPLSRPRAKTQVSDPWEMVSDLPQDLPARWAQDFVPFAQPGSKLAGQPVLFFELCRGEEIGQYGRTMLAVATPKHILLYETPKGERAFQFVKEFYTPHSARSAKFIYQASIETTSHRASAQSAIAHAVSQESLNTPPASPTSTSRRTSASTRPASVTSASPHLSLFITFKDKAVLVRVADSAVGEVDLWDDGSSLGEHSPTGSMRFSRPALDSKDSKGPWLPLSHVYLPGCPSRDSISYSPDQLFYLITRGKLTHFFPAPLPVPLAVAPPHYIHTWAVQPRQIVTRLLRERDGSSSLQLVGFGQFGAEIQEVPVQVILSGQKSKGKSKDEPREVIVHDGLEAGYLCSGGNWDKQGRPSRPIARRTSFSSMKDEVDEKAQSTGMYGWVRKDVGDERVFWLGTSDDSI